MKRGIDVSVYQGDISWAKVKVEGIDFAMIKATQGRSETQSYRDFSDSKFAQNIVGAHRYGIRIGVWHYLTAKTVSEALHEAEFFLSVIEPYRSIIDLYAAVDVESWHLPTDKTLLTQIVYTFCSRVQSAGYDPLIYTNPDWLKNRLNDISAYPLWLALWRDKDNVPTVKQYPNLRIWQWGGEAVDGIDGGKVDANFMIQEKPVEKTETPKSETVAKPDTAVSSEKPSAWAAEAFAWAKEHKILLGDGNGKYRPHDALTREEACLIAQRVFDLALRESGDRAVGYIAERLIAALGGKD